MKKTGIIFFFLITMSALGYAQEHDFGPEAKNKKPWDAKNTESVIYFASGEKEVGPSRKHLVGVKPDKLEKVVVKNRKERQFGPAAKNNRR